MWNDMEFHRYNIQFQTADGMPICGMQTLLNATLTDHIDAFFGLFDNPVTMDVSKFYQFRKSITLNPEHSHSPRLTIAVM